MTGEPGTSQVVELALELDDVGVVQVRVLSGSVTNEWLSLLDGVPDSNSSFFLNCNCDNLVCSPSYS